MWESSNILRAGRVYLLRGPSIRHIPTWTGRWGHGIIIPLVTTLSDTKPECATSLGQGMQPKLSYQDPVCIAGFKV